MGNVCNQYDAFHIDNALMYHVIAKLFADIDSHDHVKQRKVTKNNQALS